MLQEAQVVAFEGGSLRVLASGAKGREAVLALPLSRLIAKMVRVPSGEDPVALWCLFWLLEAARAAFVVYTLLPLLNPNGD